MRLNELEVLRLMRSILKQFFLLVSEILRFAVILVATAWVILLNLLSIPALFNPFGFITLFGFLSIVLGFAVAWLFADVLHSFQWRKLALFVLGLGIWHFFAIALILAGDEIDHCLDMGGGWREDRCITDDAEWEAIMEREQQKEAL